MPLFENIQHVYKHPWNDISLASWRKYPSPQRPDLLSIDLLSRHLDADTGVLKIRRLITCKGQGPTWLQNLIGSSFFFFVEETTVDPINQKMVLTSQNHSFCDLITVQETCTYTPHVENQAWTNFSQHATFTAFPFGIKGKLESVCHSAFTKNAAKGREIMEQAIAGLALEKRKLSDCLQEGTTLLQEKTNSLIQEASEKTNNLIQEGTTLLQEKTNNLIQEGTTFVQEKKTLLQETTTEILETTTSFIQDASRPVPMGPRPMT